MTRLLQICILLIFGVNCSNPAARFNKNSYKPVITIIAENTISTSTLNLIKKELTEFYHAKVTIQLANKTDEYLIQSSKCSLISADSVLNKINVLHKDMAGKVLFITNKDIATRSNGSECWGIFGLGQNPGKACIASNFRLGFGNANTQLKDLRLVKVILHEIGHTFGMPHCTNNDTCMMQSAKGKGSTLDKEKKWICDKCRQKITSFD